MAPRTARADERRAAPGKLNAAYERIAQRHTKGSLTLQSRFLQSCKIQECWFRQVEQEGQDEEEKKQKLKATFDKYAPKSLNVWITLDLL